MQPPCVKLTEHETDSDATPLLASRDPCARPVSRRPAVLLSANRSAKIGDVGLARFMPNDYMSAAAAIGTWAWTVRSRFASHTSLLYASRLSCADSSASTLFKAAHAAQIMARFPCDARCGR